MRFGFLYLANLQPLLSSEYKANTVMIFRAVGDRILSRDEVQEFQRQLSLLSEPTVRNQYIEAHAKCCLAQGRMPTPAEIQHLLCIWKVLYKWEQNSGRKSG